MPPVPPKKPFGEPEKTSLTSKLLPWLFIAAAIAGIAWMIESNPPEPTLNCSPAHSAGLTDFGSCTTN